MKRTNGFSTYGVGLVVLTVFASFLLLASEAKAQDERLSLEKYLDMESVANPQISPDGSRILYTRQWVDKVNDRNQSSLWIMNSDGSRNRHLLEGSGARWSPDGTRILFTKQGEPNGSQIFVRWMDDEGAVSQVTRLENGPSNPPLVSRRGMDRIYASGRRAWGLCERSVAESSRRRNLGGSAKGCRAHAIQA